MIFSDTIHQKECSTSISVETKNIQMTMDFLLEHIKEIEDDRFRIICLYELANNVH
jgi:hypothetical protein